MRTPLGIDYAAPLGKKTKNWLGVFRVGLAGELYFTGGLTKYERNVPQELSGLAMWKK